MSRPGHKYKLCMIFLREIWKRGGHGPPVCRCGEKIEREREGKMNGRGRIMKRA
jgi:hypothetical protein